MTRHPIVRPLAVILAFTYLVSLVGAIWYGVLLLTTYELHEVPVKVIGSILVIQALWSVLFLMTDKK